MSLARPARSALSPSPPPTVTEAEVDVALACAAVEAVRRRITAGDDGASALATAEYRHHVALRRLDEARAASRASTTGGESVAPGPPEASVPSAGDQALDGKIGATPSNGGSQ